ncbi:glycosyl transferase family 90-domain-containing protein [Cadophora sp. MPI-SDFR-AT-0126]|nr:glycosyl transferase family 90-domain-containing protein [Leotiomycetes sp. MPI-SDFR-AT-0126]
MLLRGTAFSLSIARRRRFPLLIFATLLFTSIFYNQKYHPFAPPPRNAHPRGKGSFDGTWNYTRDARNLMLSESQCMQAFPDLYHEIDRAVEDRRSNHVTLKEIDEMPVDDGYIRAMIYDQQLYMINATSGINTRGEASLQALHRAILTSPEPLPNIEFTMMVDDLAESANPRWTYSRQKSMTSLWLMPDFGYWSWPEPKIGAYSEIQMKAEQMDAKVPWMRKIDKLFWRGAHLKLLVREQLVNASRGKSWADVKMIVWDDNAKGKAHDAFTMDEHCMYKFVAHTEGVSYSARLQNLQNCRSVIVAHKLSWLQHHHHLMVSSGPNQNFVEVAKDFSDLDKTMEGLLSGEGGGGNLKAERIAENNVRTFRERYLTPAAEACYWRQLIRGWATVSFEPNFFKESTGQKEQWRGVPIESYLLMRQMEWNYH